MSSEGTYVLFLSCDFDMKPRQREYATFTAPTRMEALAMAREEGWLISKNSSAYCPEHADQRRAEWR